jgi:hypothetical protein
LLDYLQRCGCKYKRNYLVAQFFFQVGEKQMDDAGWANKPLVNIWKMPMTGIRMQPLFISDLD